MRTAVVLLDASTAQIAASHGLTMLQFDALRILSGAEGLRTSQLATRLLCDDSTLSRAVTGLVEDDLVGRDPDPSDRRAALIRLTAGGRSRLDATLAAIRSELGRTIGALDDGSIGQLQTILGQLVGIMRDGDHGAPVADDARIGLGRAAE